jgi:gluconolactonase
MIRFALLLLVYVSVCLSAPWELQAEKIGTGFEGAEGPVWAKEGYLLFSDTQTQKIHKIVPGQPATVFREASNGANGNTFDRQGRLYSCEYKSRRVTRTLKDGKIETLVDSFEGKRLNAPNDIVVRRDGHVYLTDPLFTPLDRRDLDFYGVYHLTPQGRLEVIAKPKGRPNGIALTPNGRMLYVANTDEKNIRAYDVDKEGKVSNERVVVPDLPSGPDGIKVDSDGNIYVTGRELTVYSPAGQLVGKILLPEGSRNCAFGDADLKTLYITGLKSIWKVRIPVKGSIQY